MNNVLQNLPPGMRLEEWPIERLQPWPDNPRRITDADIEKLAATMQSVERFTQPILMSTVDPYIVAGHRRWLAAKRLGLSHVPVVVHDGMDAEQVHAIRISDNRLQTDVEFDRGLLADHLTVLDGHGFIPQSLGFEEDDVLNIFDLAKSAGGGIGHLGAGSGTDGADDSDGDRDPAGDPADLEGPAPVIGLGEVWQVGAISVAVGEDADPRQRDAVLKVLKTLQRATKLKAEHEGRTLAEILKEREQ